MVNLFQGFSSEITPEELRDWLDVKEKLVQDFNGNSQALDNLDLQAERQQAPILRVFASAEYQKLGDKLSMLQDQIQAGVNVNIDQPTIDMLREKLEANVLSAADKRLIRESHQRTKARTRNVSVEQAISTLEQNLLMGIQNLPASIVQEPQIADALQRIINDLARGSDIQILDQQLSVLFQELQDTHAEISQGNAAKTGREQANLAALAKMMKKLKKDQEAISQATPSGKPKSPKKGSKSPVDSGDEGGGDPSAASVGFERLTGPQIVNSLSMANMARAVAHRKTKEISQYAVFSRPGGKTFTLKRNSSGAKELELDPEKGVVKVGDKSINVTKGALLLMTQPGDWLIKAKNEAKSVITGSDVAIYRQIRSWDGNFTIMKHKNRDLFLGSIDDPSMGVTGEGVARKEEEPPAEWVEIVEDIQNVIAGDKYRANQERKAKKANKLKRCEVCGSSVKNMSAHRKTKKHAQRASGGTALPVKQPKRVMGGASRSPNPKGRSPNAERGSSDRRSVNLFTKPDELVERLGILTGMSRNGNHSGSAGEISEVLDELLKLDLISPKKHKNIYYKYVAPFV